uniref:Uncharacterized protein n=1 Tax=Myoviridae sp. ctCo31 TaxID=2825053 RepID=A0A8S5UMV4_9CAUD|nr:MAG TPA: hypothetical protein [Myoviridae sp. ctCo31]
MFLALLAHYFYTYLPRYILDKLKGAISSFIIFILS